MLCGLAPNLAFLVLARMLQGIGGGGLAPVEQSMMVDTFPPAKRGAAFAAYGVVVIVGPILGPSLGGWITDNLSWHWVFLINVPIGLLSLFLVSLFVDEPQALEQRAQEAAARRACASISSASRWSRCSSAASKSRSTAASARTGSRAR